MTDRLAKFKIAVEEGRRCPAIDRDGQQCVWHADHVTECIFTNSELLAYECKHPSGRDGACDLCGARVTRVTYEGGVECEPHVAFNNYLRNTGPIRAWFGMSDRAYADECTAHGALMYSRLPCAHARWDANAVARVCLHCRSVLPGLAGVVEVMGEVQCR